jgi:hypothetical protein
VQAGAGVIRSKQLRDDSSGTVDKTWSRYPAQKRSMHSVQQIGLASSGLEACYLGVSLSVTAPRDCCTLLWRSVV